MILCVTQYWYRAKYNVETEKSPCCVNQQAGIFPVIECRKSEQGVKDHCILDSRIWEFPLQPHTQFYTR